MAIVQTIISCDRQNISSFLRSEERLETGGFLTRKLNQPTNCLMLQFKGKNTVKLPSDSSFQVQKFYAWSINCRRRRYNICGEA